MKDDALLKAIGEALGSQGPYQEASGKPDGGLQKEPSLEVLGGAANAALGAVAWLERRVEPPSGGFVDVDIELCVVQDGERFVLEVPSYNPFFGCNVLFAKWFGQSFCFAYEEKHCQILAVVRAPWSAFELVKLRHPSVLVGDTVVFIDVHHGVLSGWRLPQLEPMVPVTAPHGASRYPIQYLTAAGANQVEVATWIEDWQVPGGQDMGWAKLHSERERLAARDVLTLPPRGPWPDAQILRQRWLGRLKGAEGHQQVVERLGAPWLNPPPAPCATYKDILSQRDGYGQVEEDLKDTVRQGLPSQAPLLLGWPQEGTAQERLDAMFMGQVARAQRFAPHKVRR